jgi:SAM-dependent methyltransferase
LKNGIDEMESSEVFTSKLDMLRSVLSQVTLTGKIVLDAGTGRTSARGLLEKHPLEVKLLAAPGDYRKAEPAKKQLKEFPDIQGEVMLRDLADSGIFAPGSFDFVLADYLIGEVDCFTPSMLVPILQNIFSWLCPGGELLTVDMEPIEDEEGPLSLANNLQFWYQMVNLLAKHWKAKPMDYPSKLVSLWLKRAGFTNIKVAHYRRTLEKQDSEDRYQKAIERLKKLPNRHLRKGLKAELHEAISRIGSLGDSQWSGITRSNYVIRAVKEK